jgi:phosphatidate cytidylyltransferase
MLVVTLGALLEFYWIAEAKGARPNKVLGMIFGALIVFSYFHGVSDVLAVDLLANDARNAAFGLSVLWPVVRATMLLAPLIVFVVLTLALGMRNKEGNPTIDNGSTLMGVVYVALLLGSTVGLRQLFPTLGNALHAHSLDEAQRLGFYLVMTTLVTIWTCDSGAYYAGRAFGKHKLFERVSPKKTWEGAIGGAITAILVASALRYWLLPMLTVADGIVIGLIVGIFGQIGDLAESHLKRDAGVKDSSSIIPGHGGILDRFDSLMFVAPLVYLYLFVVLMLRTML